MSYCMNGAKTTVNSFWKDVNSHCPKDPHKLIDLYEQIVGEESSATDKCKILLQHQVRKSLVDSSAVVLEEAFLSQTFRNNLEIERLANRIYLSDPLTSELIFKKFIDEVYLLADKSELLLVLFKNRNFQQMVASLLHFNWKLNTHDDYDARLSSQMAFYMLYIQQHRQFSLLPAKLKQRFLKTINAIPPALLNLLSLKEVRILNIGQWEYLYAPRELGPNAMKRTAFTWTAEKNTTDNDGNLVLEFNDDGNLAIGSYYDGVIRYLYVDENDLKPYYLLSKGGDETRWWQMYYYEDYVAFRNAKTKQLLCATISFDAYRRYVTLSETATDYDIELPCRWLILDQQTTIGTMI